MSKEVRQTLAQLWLRMSEIYGAQFANQYGAVGGESFQTWALGLQDLTPKMIKHGFAKLLERENTFVPNLNEFRKLCKPCAEDYGLPSVDAAYREAARNSHRPLAHQWSHPAVYWAGREVSWFRLGSEIQKVTYPEFKKEYESICELVYGGKEFSMPEPDATALEHHTNGKKVNTEQSKAAGREALAGLKGKFRGMV
ncbi:MAG: replication protein P [Amphritea sp.]